MSVFLTVVGVPAAAAATRGGSLLSPPREDAGVRTPGATGGYAGVGIAARRSSAYSMPADDPSEAPTNKGELGRERSGR